MTFQILVSTMHQKDYSLLERMNIHSSAVVINQCDKESREEIVFRDKHILWINTKERGLSRSRNMAIRNATSDICLIADDDEVFLDNCEEVIKKCFEGHSDCSILRFKIEGIEKPFKTYPTEEFSVSFLKSLKVSSVEIAFKRDKIADKIFFDERIGAGTDFYMGEENAFLIECLKKGLKIYYIPQIIAQLHIGESTWFEGYTEKYFVSRGAAFAAMKTKFTYLLCLQFAVRKYKLFKEKMGPFKATKLMFKGIKMYYGI